MKTEKNPDALRILAIGDIVGSPGRAAVAELCPRLRSEQHVDFIVANAENAAGGNGITPKLADELFQSGVDCITLGDHVWDQKEISDYLSKEPRIIRPINYPAGVPGHGSTVLSAQNGTPVAIINALGRAFLHVFSENPFACVAQAVKQASLKTNVIVLDFHAEATSEKIAIFRYLDGQISLIFGSHTHVQTADEQISPKGTAYITDCGMTGPHDSIIGRVTNQVLHRLMTQMPGKMEVAQGDVRLCGVIADIDKNTGRALQITRAQWMLEEKSQT